MATEDFFRARLDSMIDMRHPLAVLATRMPWTEIEASLAPLLAHKDRSGRLIQDADCRPQIGDLQTVARQNGIDWRQQKSSHCVFIRNDGRTLSVPAQRPIKPIYVRKFVELIDGA